MDPKKIMFITGTRADYGKMKPLMKILDNNPLTEVYIFVCGMHLSETFGSTYNEVFILILIRIITRIVKMCIRYLHHEL